MQEPKVSALCNRDCALQDHALCNRACARCKASVLQSTNRYWKFPMVITSNIAAVSDSKVIVDASRPCIEPEEAYGQKLI